MAFPQLQLTYQASVKDVNVFQFQATDSNGNVTLYNILYAPNANYNAIQIEIPTVLPSFMQSFNSESVSYPLTFETGGYNTYTSAVEETAVPVVSLAASYRPLVTSTSTAVDHLVTLQGDFSLEFRHSFPVTQPYSHHPVTYSSSTNTPPVYFIDVDFEPGLEKPDEPKYFWRSDQRWEISLSLFWKFPPVIRCTPIR